MIVYCTKVEEACVVEGGAVEKEMFEVLRGRAAQLTGWIWFLAVDLGTEGLEHHGVRADHFCQGGELDSQVPRPRVGN